ncbi:MAG: PAS domain S-box protein, partial [Bacteroidetes bacterium]|nr:PAS domain S-box protein [Bacteroidota bacterium]
ARKALEREYTKPNGQNIVIQGIINPVKTEKGYILVSTSEDITIRKKTQEALEISEKKSKSLMQQSPFVVELYDINGLQIEVNKAYEDLWEFPAETTVNKFNVLLSKEVEDTGLMKYVKRAYAGEAVEVPEYEFNPTGETESKGFGRVRWLNTRIYPIKDNQNNVTNIVIVHQDVTERNEAEQLLKQSEEKFRSIFESNIVGVIFWNAEGEISDANELFLGLMGYTKKELLNKEIRWKDMTPPEYAQYDKEMLIELSEKGFVTPFEKEYFHKDGHRIPIIIGAATLTSMENSGVAFILDISKRKKSEEEIIRYRDHLEEMVRDRTKELEDKNADLERFNELFVNREFRIKELRDKVKELEAGL